MLPRDFFPKSTGEILWVHPINIEFNEVLSRVKTKRYHELLQEPDMEIKTVHNLP